MSFATPVRDMRFALMRQAGFEPLARAGAFEELNDELLEAVTAEMGKFCDGVIAPLNEDADRVGSRLENGVVRTAPGFKEAYAQYVEGGWMGLSMPEAYGGQALPESMSLMMVDAVNAACMGFAIGLTLTTGAAKAILHSASDELKEVYLPKMVSGEWTGAMNLTEPQAGSDLSAVRAKAEPVGDGRYKISGEKIFITYGEHDMADNIVHLVLARLPDAPEGTRGISMFLTPKHFVNADGSLGARNDFKCTGLEHKMGLHGSPTCSMSFGDNGECYGFLVGEENRGLQNMFVMMNAARLDVGLQGVGVAERAFQRALAFAQDRRQGRRPGVKTGDMVPIYEHPDVRRMLFTQKAMVEASRAICYAEGVAIDTAHTAGDDATARAAKEREELLTPIAKAFATDRANDVASLGVQVHGGMGFIEETGAAQHMRDARIAAIYEGTNGIQAIDLVGRKLGMGGGKLVRNLLDEARETASALKAASDADLNAVGDRLKAELETVAETTDWLVEKNKSGVEDALAGAVPYLKQLGLVAGGHYIGRGALAAAEAAEAGDDAKFHKGKVAIARFYADNLLPEAGALAKAATAGAETVAPIDPAALTG